MRALCVLALVAACGNGAPATATATAPTPPTTLADRVLALLPQGAQVVIELDLARLRANPVVGTVVTKALSDGTFEQLPGDMPASPLAIADHVVLAAYGVGTPSAATVVVLGGAAAAQAKQLAALPEIVRLTDDIYALGPVEWTAQLEERATLTLGTTVIAAPPELLALRDRAMPEGAPGASLRVTARLPADARDSLAQQVGVAVAPAQLSVWADFVDDFVIIIDAEASEAARPKAVARLEAMIKKAIVAVADTPAVKALGLPASLGRARLVKNGAWVRTIIAIGPAHLKRVVARATELLEKPPAAAGGG